MATEDSGSPVEATIEELAALYDEHRLSAGTGQRLANTVTRLLGRPSAVAIVLLAIAMWIIGNDVAGRAHAFESFPFAQLELAATIAALSVAMLVLTTQRHEEQLGEKRARLTLQIAVLSEKKIAKVIALLEEQRRDNPMLTSRADREAELMAKPSDPRANLEQLEQREDGDPAASR
jgi:uncharacterized membrane protein